MELLHSRLTPPGSIGVPGRIRGRTPRLDSDGALLVAFKSEVFVWSLLIWMLVAACLVVLPIHR
jgi:hypothetical protein